jgi:hypothetical protein
MAEADRRAQTRPGGKAREQLERGRKDSNPHTQRVVQLAA